jgi:hypothetical protein
MNLRDTTIPSAVSDLGSTVVEILPIETVTGAVDGALDVLPDLDTVTDVAVEIGRTGSRRVVRVAGTVRRHPYRSVLILSALVGVLVGLAIVKQRRSSDAPQLTMAEAA